MIPTNQVSKKQFYAPPHLEEHQYLVVTGVSLPIGTSGSPIEFNDFMNFEEQP